MKLTHLFNTQYTSLQLQKMYSRFEISTANNAQKYTLAISHVIAKSSILETGSDSIIMADVGSNSSSLIYQPLMQSLFLIGVLDDRLLE
jgi:hypothetical protein